MGAASATASARKAPLCFARAVAKQMFARQTRRIDRKLAREMQSCLPATTTTLRAKPGHRHSPAWPQWRRRAARSCSGKRTRRSRAQRLNLMTPRSLRRSRAESQPSMRHRCWRETPPMGPLRRRLWRTLRPRAVGERGSGAPGVPQPLPECQRRPAPLPARRWLHGPSSRQQRRSSASSAAPRFRLLLRPQAGRQVGRSEVLPVALGPARRGP